MVHRAGLEKRLMGAHACDPSVVQDDDLVRIPDGADPLAHDELGGILQLPVEALPEGGIGAVVQGGEGVVKDQDLRLPGQGSASQVLSFFLSVFNLSYHE